MAWTAAFWFTVPIALLYPIWHWHWYSTAAAAASSSATVPPLLPAAASPLAKHPLSFATLHAITWSIAVVVVLTRYLYRSVAGGDGDAARILAAQLIATAAPMSVLVYAFLTVTVWSACPTAALAAVVPAAYGMRDVCAFRQWRQRTDFAGAGYASRIAFFQAMVGMALDILSRSLRRASLVRGLTTVLLCQLAILLLWRASLLAALSLLFAKRSEAGIWNWMLVFLSWGAGRWATATAMRVLTLLASAGVMNWCNEQGMLLSEVTANGGGGGANLRENGNTSSHNHTEDDNEFAHTNSNNGTSRIPEAYRTVDASVYQSVLSLEDVLDDDDEDDDVVDGNAGLEMNHNDDRRWQHSRQSPHQLQSNNRNASTAQQHHQQHPRQTVKSILWTGVTINFGAIAHCGMLGGLAQLIWSQIRRVEAASATSRNNGPLGVRSGDGGEQFQGMAIGTSSGSNDSMVNQLWTRAIILARSFVRLHSDLAMTHVAAYYKGYARAARDVAMIIDETGTFAIKLFWYSVCFWS